MPVPSAQTAIARVRSRRAYPPVRRVASLALGVAVLATGLALAAPAGTDPADPGIRVAPFRWEPAHRTTG